MDLPSNNLLQQIKLNEKALVNARCVSERKRKARVWTEKEVTDSLKNV